MALIHVKAFTTCLVGYEEGLMLFNVVARVLARYGGAELDFTNRDGADSSFLEGFLGKLMASYPPGELRGRLRLLNISTPQRQEFYKYVENEKTRLETINT